MQIQLYNGKKDNLGNLYTVDQAIENIKENNDLRQKTTKLRKAASNGNTTQADIIKGALPAVTWSGTFKSRKAADLTIHSGLICLDIDHINDVASSKQVISDDSFTFICFTSPSGKGLKVIIKTSANQKNHKEYFAALESYYLQKFQINIDKSGKDVTRLCFLCHDEFVFVNPKSQTFEMPNSIESVFHFTEKIIPYSEGSRNKFLYLFANNCNRKGFAMMDCREFAFAKFPDREPAEIKQSIENAYGHTNENGKFKTGKKSIANDLGKYSSESDLVFYSPIFKSNEDGAPVLKDIKINYVKFIELLYSFGFRRFDIQRDFIYIHLKDAVIKEVSKMQIQDYFFKYLEQLPDVLENGITKRNLKEKMYNNPNNYFCDNRLSLLINKSEILFNADTKHECFIYYKNGFVKCNSKGWTLSNYKELAGHIWENQIIDREFKFLQIEDLPIEKLSPYAQFLHNVCGKDDDRFTSLCSLVGYLLHGFTEVKMKAIILTDSKVSDEANGRTGKTLFGQTLRHIKKLTQINGKDFDATNRYKYQEANLDTQIIFLNDIRTNFRFEVLYNDITEGITVEKKNQDPFNLKIKMCITTNKTIAIEGSSSKDRCIEFEFANHYNENFSPEDEFKHRFFSDWDSDAWMQFDNFMMYCISLYLNVGVVAPKNINLGERKLLDQTHKYFLEFMQERISAGEIAAGKEFCKQELHKDFMSEYPELEEDKFRKRLETFTKWLKIFAKHSGHFGENTLDRKSGSKRFFTFIQKQ